MPHTLVHYKPSAYYYRRAIRQNSSVEALQKIGMELVTEHERLRAWVRAQGLIPPKFVVLADEARDKGWSMV